VVAEVAGRRQFIASLRHGTFGFAADDGRLLWESASGLEGGAHSSTPLVVGDAVWTSWRWKGGLSLLELTRKPDGIQVTPGYSRKFEFYTFQDSAICLDNHVYGFGPTSSLHCFNLWTGDAVWGPVRLDGTANCSMVLADGRLYVVANTGTVLLGTPSPEGLTEESRFKIPRFRRDIATTNPVVAGGHLYLRDDQRLLRFDVRRGAEARPPGRVELDLGRGVVAHVSNRAVFVPTPYDVVEKMMDAANVGKDDVVYDLGSGDGRILVSAARRGARATGIEIDPDLVRISRENAARAGFADRVRIEPADLLTAEMSTASVVALYLPESFLERLKPKFAGLKPGTRIVSHQVRIPKVRVDGERTFESPEDGVLHRLYLYTCPLTEVP
jgi:hypothetical protein